MEKGRWVCGFAFYTRAQHNDTFVVLIEKMSGPDIILGTFNGVGGKIEAEESPGEAMRREFREEAGVDIYNWRCFGIMEVQGYGEVVFYTVNLTDEQFAKVSPQEQEPVCICSVDRLPSKVMANLKWLIPMALDRQHVRSDMEVDYGRK